MPGVCGGGPGLGVGGGAGACAGLPPGPPAQPNLVHQPGQPVQGEA